MRRERALIPCALVACLAVITASSARAAVLVTHVGVNPYNGWTSTGGTGNIAGQANGIATLEKDFTSNGDIPIILHSDPSTGVDFIRINERVRNNTGVAWTDFHFIFGRIDANPALGVEFQNVTNPTGEWTTITPGVNSLTLLGNVPDGGIFSLSFDLKVTSVAGAFDLFGIHEVPSVPEPSTAMLLGVAALALLGRSCTRRPA